MKSLLALTMLLTGILLLTAPHGQGQSGSPIILDISDIAGSSTVNGYENKIDLLSVSYNALASPSPGTPAQLSDINMTMELDPKTYPALFAKVLTNATFTSGFKIAGLANSGVGLRVTYELEIQGKYTALSHDATAGGGRSHVYLAIRPTQIKITTKSYNPATLAVDGTFTTTWPPANP